MSAQARTEALLTTPDRALKLLRDRWPDLTFSYSTHEYENELRVRFYHQGTPFYQVFPITQLMRLKTDAAEHIAHRVNEHVVFVISRSDK